MATRKRLFGTDGIRDVAGEGALRPDLVLRLGTALARVAAENGRRTPRVFLGRDTRASGPLLEAALTAGLLAGGARPESGGVLPTPAVALLTRRRRCALGIVLSASHNPYQDNGIKVFSADAGKLPDETEQLIETLARATRVGLPGRIPTPVVVEDAASAYLDAVLRSIGRMPDLSGLRIVVDAANGAASFTAPEALARLGAEVRPIHIKPDGRTINRRCGALHPEVVARAVRKHAADLGIALDGDADRAMLVDETGRVQDGDAMLLVLARDLLARRRLPHRTVVGTVMTNVGLERALRADGLALVRTDVGDRHIARAMTTEGFGLGGEPSGHVLVQSRRRPLIGDGLITALLVLRVMKKQGRPLSSLTEDLIRAPQELVNVPVRRKPRLLGLRPVREASREAERVLGDRGRVLLRYSGTERLARVMVEGPEARDHAVRIADVIRDAIGDECLDRKDES